MFTCNGEKPIAAAEIRGSREYKTISGKVDFYATYGGTIVLAEIHGLPEEYENAFLGFHIHSKGSCTGNADDPFANAGLHYNPENTPHPEHAGDLPPLLGSKGTAWMAIYTNRFYPEDVIGKTVIVHSKPDDFRTQPSGDSGVKIACGEIKDWQKR